LRFNGSTFETALFRATVRAGLTELADFVPVLDLATTLAAFFTVFAFFFAAFAILGSPLRLLAFSLYFSADWRYCAPGFFGVT